METQTITPNSTLKNIREIVYKHPELPLKIKCGLCSELDYTLKREFGEKILDFVSRDNTEDIVFEGVVDNTLVFQVITKINPNWIDTSNSRGYGQGRYMGD